MTRTREAPECICPCHDPNRASRLIDGSAILGEHNCCELARESVRADAHKILDILIDRTVIELSTNDTDPFVAEDDYSPLWHATMKRLTGHVERTASQILDCQAAVELANSCRGRCLICGDRP